MMLSKSILAATSAILLTRTYLIIDRTMRYVQNKMAATRNRGQVGNKTSSQQAGHCLKVTKAACESNDKKQEIESHRSCCYKDGEKRAANCYRFSLLDFRRPDNPAFQPET